MQDLLYLQFLFMYQNLTQFSDVAMILNKQTKMYVMLIIPQPFYIHYYFKVEGYRNLK